MDDINKIKPELSKIKKDKHFRIPDGYFDDFSVRLGERIHRESDAGFYERYILTLKPYLAIAALFIGMIILGKITYNVLYKGNISYELNNDEIAQLIEEDIYYFSEELIIDIVYQNDNQARDESINSESDNSTNEIIDYLIDEDIDVFDIIEAL